MSDAPRTFLPPTLLTRLSAASDRGPVAGVGSRPVGPEHFWPAPWRNRPVQPDRVSRSGSAVGPRRTVDDAAGRCELPGDVARREGDAPVGDAEVDSAYASLGRTWTFFFQVLGRNSLDGLGAALDLTVRFGGTAPAALWDGSRVVVGDGDDALLPGLALADDVVGHLVSQGVIQHAAGLRAEGEAGALAIALSDVFAVLAGQYAAGTDAAAANWLVGAGLLPGLGPGAAVRSLRAPGTAYASERLGTDDQVASMTQWRALQAGSGSAAAHAGAGLPASAFCLAATALGGPAWDRAGRVWYDALTSGLPVDCSFAAFAAATREAAMRRFGAGDVHQAVDTAWAAVGLS